MQREAASEIGEEAEEATNSKEEERAGGEGPDRLDVAVTAGKGSHSIMNGSEAEQRGAATNTVKAQNATKVERRGRGLTADGARRMRRGTTIAVRDGGSNSDLLREAEDR